MRIIAGIHRGRPILPPPGRNTRPITDRVKESLFAILACRVQDARVADLFAGTGSLGLEALSRQAVFCLFCERDRPALRILHQNIRSLKLTENSEVSAKSAWQFTRWAAPVQPFDIIFMDPPYNDSRDASPRSPTGTLLCALAESRLLDPSGLVVLRHETAYPRHNSYHSLIVSDVRAYGSMTLSFLKRTENHTDAETPTGEHS